MGYYSRMCGEIEIDPLLTHAEVTRVEALDDYAEFELVTHVAERETDQGVLISKSAGVIAAAFDDQFKAYWVTEHLQAIVDAIGPGHTFRGYFFIEGESAGDLWRLIVNEDGEVEEVRPKIEWPA